MLNTVTHITFIVLCVEGISGKIFSNCEFARALINNAVSRNQVAEYVCIAQHESGFNTQAVNSDTGDYGILQISHLYWSVYD